MKYYLYIIFIALCFSGEKFTQKPVDYRAKTIQLNQQFIPSNSILNKYFDEGIMLDKGSTIEITIYTDEGVKARFDKKVAKKLKVIMKNRKDIKYLVIPLPTTVNPSKRKLAIQITAKKNLKKLKLSELFDQIIPHLSIKKAIAGKSITIHFNLDDEIKWIIPFSDNTLTLDNSDLLLSKSEDIIITTIKGYPKSNGYLNKGDIITIDLDSDQFDIETIVRDEYDISSDGRLVKINVKDTLYIRDLSIDISGSYRGVDEGNFSTKIYIDTGNWTSYVSENNDKVITIGDIDYDILIPAITIEDKKINSMAYISLISGNNQLLKEHDELKITINKMNIQDIKFNRPDHSTFTHGEINLVSEDIILTLSKDLKPGEHMEVLKIPFITNINKKNVISDLSESVSIQFPLQGNPKVNIENIIMKPVLKKVTYQRYEDLTIFLKEQSHVKILTDNLKEDKKIKFAHNEVLFKYDNKLIDPNLSISTKQIDLEIPDFKIGDSFELLTYNRFNGGIKQLLLQEVVLTDLNILWDREDNMRILNTSDGPHKIHFNIKDEYQALSVGNIIIIEIDNKSSLVFSDTKNQNSPDKKSLIFTIDNEDLLDEGDFYVSGAINTNGIVDFNFTVKSDNWKKEIKKKEIRVGHPSVSIGSPQSIIVNRSLNPLPSVIIEKNEFLLDTDSIMVSLYDNNNLPIKITQGINYSDSHDYYNIITLPFEKDSSYNFSSEKIVQGSIETARIEIKLLSEFNKVIFSKDPVLIKTNPNITILDPLGYNYWVGNDTAESDGVQITIDAVENKTNLYEEEFTLRIDIPGNAGCKWGPDIKGDTIYKIKNNERSLVFALNPEKISSLKTLGEITELGFFKLISSDVSQREPFSFHYKLTETPAKIIDEEYQFYDPEIKFVKSTSRKASREDIYVPIGSTYDIRLDDLFLIDNGTYSIFEKGDTCLISFDSEGYFWKEIEKIPEGINIIAGDNNFHFQVTKNNINSLIFNDLVIKYDGDKKEPGSVARIILDVNKHYSGKSKHKLYFEQKIHHTELTIDIEPNEIVWTRDKHKTPNISIRGDVVNLENNIILKINSDGEKDNSIAWQSKNSLVDKDKISSYKVYDDSLVLSLSITNQTNNIIIPEWELIKLDSPESIVTVDISTDGGQNFQDKNILIKNASFNDIYISKPRKLLAVKNFQYIGKIVVEGHKEFSSISQGQVLQIVFRSEKSAIKGLSTDQLNKYIGDISLFNKVRNKKIDSKTIQYSFTFAQSIEPLDKFEIDSLKIMPGETGVTSDVYIDYAIRNKRDKKDHTVRMITMKDTLHIYGIKLLSEKKQKIFDLSMDDKREYDLPILSIIEDVDMPLIESGDKLLITIKNINNQVIFREPEFPYSKITFLDVGNKTNEILIYFNKELDNDLDIPLTIFRSTDNSPMELSQIKGKFILDTDEIIDFDWPSKVAFSNGVPSFKLAENRDFLINAGPQNFPNIIIREDSLMTNMVTGDYLAIVLPNDINAQWDKSIISVNHSKLIDINNILYSASGDIVRIKINDRSKLNDIFEISGLRLNHILNERSDGYRLIEIKLERNDKHNSLLKPMTETGKIRTGNINVILSPEQYITETNHLIGSLELEFDQIEYPSLFIDELWLELEKRDATSFPAAKWKKKEHYKYGWEDEYSILDIENHQKRLKLKLKNDIDLDIMKLGITLDGLELEKPKKTTDKSYEYGINLLYKAKQDSVLSTTYESLFIQYDKKVSCFCAEMDGIILGIDGLKPIDRKYDIQIIEAKIGNDVLSVDKFIYTEFDASENKILFSKIDDEEFMPNIPIIISVRARINQKTKKLSPYLEAFCDDCNAKHYTKVGIELNEYGSKIVLNKVINNKSLNFQSVEIDGKPNINDDYIDFNISFNPKAPQCAQKKRDYIEAKTELEAYLADSTLRKKSNELIRTWTGKDGIITRLTKSDKDFCEEPYDPNTIQIKYLYALAHNYSTDGSAGKKCAFYIEATKGKYNEEFKILPECTKKENKKHVDEFISIMEKNEKYINDYYDKDDYKFSESVINKMRLAQNELLQIVSTDPELNDKEIRNNKRFHKSNIDLAMIFEDTKYLEDKKYLKQGKISKNIVKKKDYDTKLWIEARENKYATIKNNQNKTDITVEEYVVPKSEREMLTTDAISIKFRNNIEEKSLFNLPVHYNIQPQIKNNGPNLNLHGAVISDFDNNVEFHEKGIYQIDLNLEKEKNKSLYWAGISSMFLVLLFLI